MQGFMAGELREMDLQAPTNWAQRETHISERVLKRRLQEMLEMEEIRSSRALVSEGAGEGD